MSRKEIQREKNEQCAERHALAVDRLRSMVSEETAAEKYRPFFQDTAIFLLELENVRRKISEGIWESYTLEQMQSLNEILYSDLLGITIKRAMLILRLLRRSSAEIWDSCSAVSMRRCGQESPMPLRSGRII